jgi:ferredoxin-type protein NapH
MSFSAYRKITQILVFVIMFLIPVLNLYEIYTLTGTFYAINIGRLGIADPAVIMQAVFASGTLTVPLAGAALFPLLAALLFGRIWCGWLCPYHFVADCAAWVRAKIRPKPATDASTALLPVPGSFRANMFRFGFLIAGTAAAGAIGVPLLNYVNAPGILSTEAMILVKERAVSLEIAFIASLVLLELTVLPRFWCRLFCPTGAVISPVRTPYTLRVVNRMEKLRKPCCTAVACAEVCPMGLTPAIESTDLLCTNCGRCIDACRACNGESRLHFSGFSGNK